MNKKEKKEFKKKCEEKYLEQYGMPMYKVRMVSGDEYYVESNPLYDSNAIIPIQTYEQRFREGRCGWKLGMLMDDVIIIVKQNIESVTPRERFIWRYKNMLEAENAVRAEMNKE